MMLKVLSKSKYPNEVFYFLTEHNFIIYVQFIIGPKRKKSYLLKKSSEDVLEHLISDSILNA